MLVFLIGGYITVKTTNNNRFSRIESEMSSIDTRLNHVEEQTKITSEIITSLAELKTEMRTLRTSVEKHNGVVERTVVLERDQKTLWKRQDELRDELHEFQHEQHAQHAHGSDNK
jgi:chromosome segregation ATPase